MTPVRHVSFLFMADINVKFLPGLGVVCDHISFFFFFEKEDCFLCLFPIAGANVPVCVNLIPPVVHYQLELVCVLWHAASVPVDMVIAAICVRKGGGWGGGGGGIPLHPLFH
ncbi:hypothetical protein M758_UG336900 [Ceratodon purpureus]|nr:hypothetical protein M758_UG336900 [Ceratodon purpureus]